MVTNSANWESGGGGSGPGGLTVIQTGGGSIIAEYQWDTNQDWDQTGTEKTNIEHPTVNHSLRTTEISGYFLDDYTNTTLLSSAVSTSINATDELTLKQEFNPGDGSDGDLILSGTPSSGSIWSVYCGEYYDSDTLYGADFSSLTGTNSVYMCSNWIIENFIGDDKCIVDSNVHTWSSASFDATFTPGRELRIMCMTAPENSPIHTPSQDIKSVGRYEFVYVKESDSSQRTVTFTSPKVNKYGSGGVTDLAIGGSSYSRDQRFIVCLTRVMNFRNVILGNPGTGITADVRSTSYFGNLAISNAIFPSSNKVTPKYASTGPLFRCSGTLTLDNGGIDCSLAGYSTANRHAVAAGKHYGQGGSIVPGHDIYPGALPANSRSQYPDYSGGGSSRVQYAYVATGGGNYAAGMTDSMSTMSGGRAYTDIYDDTGTALLSGDYDESRLLLGGAGAHATFTYYYFSYYTTLGNGGGLIQFTADTIIINPGGYIQNNGGGGGVYSISSPTRAALGAGAGGTTHIACKNFINNSSLATPIEAKGGAGGTAGSVEYTSGGAGRTILKYVNWTGNTWTEPGFLPKQISGIYDPSGTATSTNLLTGRQVTQIDTIDFYVNNLPIVTTLSARYSQDGITWYNSQSAVNTYDSITASGNYTVNLSALNWNTPYFYYQLSLNTTDTDYTPVIDSTAINFTPNVYETAGIWKSNVVSYGSFDLQPKTIQALWTMDGDATPPKFQLIGDNIATLNSSDAVTLPAPGFYYQDTGVWALQNNLELSLAGLPFRKFWRVQAELDAGSDITDSPTIDRFNFRATSTVTPSAIFEVALSALSSVGTDILPAVSARYNIGSSTLPWKSIYISNSATPGGVYFTGVSGSNTGIENLRVIDLEPQLDREWTPENIPGLLAWFDSTPLSAGGGLGLTSTSQVTSWTPKGTYTSAFAGTSNTQSNGPEWVNGNNVLFENGYFTSTTPITGVAYVGIYISIHTSQSNAGQLNTCCPPLFDVSWHGETGGAGTQLFTTTFSHAGGEPIQHGAAYVNGQLCGNMGWYNTSLYSDSIINLKKSPEYRFIEILCNPTTLNTSTGLYGKVNLSAICKQSSYTDRQLWCTVGDIMAFDRHPTVYQRKKLFEWMQRRHPKLWKPGW